MTLTVETWIEALESGKYRQGKEALRVDGSFCCLGVACDLSRQGKWDGAEYVVMDDGEERPYQEFLPHDVQETLGLRTPDGKFHFSALSDDLRDEIRHRYLPSGDQATLVGINDAGLPFPLIAKVIRARPKGLFREEAQP